MTNIEDSHVNQPSKIDTDRDVIHYLRSVTLVLLALRAFDTRLDAKVSK